MAACLHVTAETANLAIALKAGGADLVLCATNPLSTQDDVAAALVEDYGISVFAIKGEDNETYYRHIDAALEHQPHITMDDGADLVGVLHNERTELLPRRRSAARRRPPPASSGCGRWPRDGVLGYPIVAVNDAQTKHMFDNRYGTGQSTIDGIIRATNLLLAGKRLRRRRLRLVRPRRGDAGQGPGRERHRHRGRSAQALEAAMDGFRVMPMATRRRSATSSVTVTGNMNVIRPRALRVDEGRRHRRQQRPLRRRARPRGAGRIARDRSTSPASSSSEYTLKNGNRVIVLGEGRLVNLAAAEGHPASVMDMSFANQALCSRVDGEEPPHAGEAASTRCRRRSTRRSPG